VGAVTSLSWGPELDIALKAFVGALLGYLVGLERNLAGQAAGARTFSLVAAGSALFTALGFEAFGPQSGEAASRIAQNVLTGIGFLGGGMILREGGSVRGLTTAAGMWAVAAVGMAIGAGYYVVGALASVLIVVVLAIGHLIRPSPSGPADD
jgi:putative Mg2+ transporter-C (MgtC) family protein